MEAGPEPGLLTGTQISSFPSMIFLKVLNSRVEFPARLSVNLCPANHRHRVGQRAIFGVHPVQSDLVDTLGLG